MPPFWPVFKSYSLNPPRTYAVLNIIFFSTSIERSPEIDVLFFSCFPNLSAKNQSDILPSITSNSINFSSIGAC